MANAMFLSMRGSGGGTIELPAQNGRMAVNHMHMLERQTLPTDPIGSVTITLTGVKPGSEVVAFGTNGQPLSTIPASGTSAAFTLQRYASGSPNNSVRFMVLALNYEVVDFDYTLGAVDATIPVFQRIDRSYRNPA